MKDFYDCTHGENPVRYVVQVLADHGFHGFSSRLAAEDAARWARSGGIWRLKERKA